MPVDIVFVSFMLRRRHFSALGTDSAVSPSPTISYNDEDSP